MHGTCNNRSSVVHRLVRLTLEHEMEPRYDGSRLPCRARFPLGRIVILTLFSVAVVNAGYNTITKDALSKGKVDALVFSLLRDACAFPILQLAAYCIDGPLWPNRADVPLLFVLGLTGMFGNQFLFIEGLDNISADVASILNLAQAPIAAAVAIAVGQEQFSWRRLGGIGLAVCGAVVLLAPWQAGSSSKGNTKGSSKAIGYLCVLGSCCSMATYYIVQKPALRRYRRSVSLRGPTSLEP